MRDEDGVDKFILDLKEKPKPKRKRGKVAKILLGFLLLLLVVLICNFYFFQENSQKTSSEFLEKNEVEVEKVKSEEGVEKTEARLPTLIPLELEIPILNLRANIIEVGIDEEGNMAVPKNVKEIGWYEPGYFPGELGHAVLSGHVTSKLGLPAVFKDLKKVEIGDEFILYGANNKKMTFSVVDINIYDYKTAPLEKIFGKSDVPMVNLITCDTGVWLGNSYQDRLVVSGVLVKEEEIEKTTETVSENNFEELKVSE